MIERHFIASLLLVSLQKWKAGKLQDAAPVEQRKYCRIKTKLLLDVNPLNVDIYARLSESKYIKVLQKNDTFDNADLDKYDQQKKIEYMYLLTDDIGNFIQKYIAYIEEVVRQKKNISIDELAEMNGSIYESVRELTEKIGFTQEVAALAKSQVRLTVKTMGKKPVLKNILYQIEGKSGQYLGDHSLLTGFLACGIAAQMEWNSESTFHKLMLASFMHDISISDNRIAECESIADAEALHLSANEMAAFQKHPFRIAEFIRKMSDIPPDVDSIVMQHHELPGGEGFPRGLTSSYIAPLSGIFIVAHHMAKEVLKDRERFDLRQYLQRMHQKWPQALFKRILISASGLAL